VPTVADFLNERARLTINQDECIRCGACAEVCPVACISMRKIIRLPAAPGTVRIGIDA
jgi:formate hydrogenlyase subunit 6/NADH:ubiquinone oxidoreductase subunit I